MTKRNKRLVILMIIQVVALFVMVFRGIHKPWEITVAGGLTVGTAITCAIVYTPSKDSSSNGENRS